MKQQQSLVASKDDTGVDTESVVRECEVDAFESTAEKPRESTLSSDALSPVPKKAKLDTRSASVITSANSSTAANHGDGGDKQVYTEYDEEESSSFSGSETKSECDSSEDHDDMNYGDDQEQHETTAHQKGEGQSHLDEEDVDLDEDESPQEESLFRRILAAAASGGVPLELLAAQGIFLESDDDETLEYPFDEAPKSLEDVAHFIQSDKCKRILCLAGAGMSEASGIPDFRSSTGLYATLDATRLTATQEQIETIQRDPSFSLDFHLFLENPLPCLEVNREFILGVHGRKWKATLAHRFVELLQTKTSKGPGKLVRLYTQNIDGLEDQCEGISDQRRIAVHGSMDEAECAHCNAKMDFERFCCLVKRQIKDISGQDPTAPKQSKAIICESCGHNTVKPSIVLFRSRLPDVFFQHLLEDMKDIDLLIVLGTSLAVAPANSLVWRVPKSAMRVLINRESVGHLLGLDFQRNDRDYFARGDCENVVLDLMERLEWLEHLRPLLDRYELPEASALLLQERLAALDQKPPPKQATDATVN